MHLKPLYTMMSSQISAPRTHTQFKNTHTILFLTLLPALTGQLLSLVDLVEEQRVCSRNKRVNNS